MITTDKLFPQGARRGDALTDRLGSAWKSIVNGSGSKEDAELVLGDLAELSGYFYVAPRGTDPAELLRREGARELFARILFLLDVETSYLGAMRQQALTEMQVTNEEGER